MTESVFGKIKEVDEDNRLIKVVQQKKTGFYYMSRGMFKQFMDYFHENIYVFLSVKDEPRLYKGLKVQNVVSIDKIISPKGNKPKIYYDISMIKTEIKKLVNQRRHRLFIDFEMSMPPYKNYQSFVSEIIQVGYVLTDEYGQVIDKQNAYIKPTLFPKLSKRTLKFLEITQENVDQGKSYLWLHEKLTNIQDEFMPIIFTWGKNDKFELKKLNKIYKLDQFINDMQFVDLLSLHKTYYRLKNDLGLFNAYNVYAKQDISDQKHDALEDAEVTKDVFYWFKDVCNHKMKVDI